MKDRNSKPSEKDKKNSKPSVLVVDDVPSILMSVQHALEDFYQVHVLSRSEDVIDFLRNTKPDLILLDYLMPILTGFDILPIIKAMPDYKNTPIIIITTEGKLEYVKEAITLGAADYILKPFNNRELREKVAKHLGEL